MRSVASCSSILIVSPNWLGDFVMALPAVTRFHRAHPGVRLSILCKPFLRDLWTKVDGIAPERVFTFPPQGVKKSFLQTRETFAMGRQLRACGFEAAVLFPNSFRSALIAAVAGIPVRRGTGLHARRFLINDPVRFSAGETRTLHQSREYLKLLCGDSAGDLSETGFASARPGFPAGAVPSAFLQGAPLIGVIPGAARGDSKRWPFFAQAIAHIAGACPEARFVCLGTDKEHPLCEQTLQEAVALAPQLAGRLVNAAGTTHGTADFFDALCACSCVLCNDSGGMHLASAGGVPVVAVYGLTDPAKTGPIGKGAIIVQAEGVRPSRAIARTDPAAAAALRSVSPDRVAAACLAVLRAKPGTVAAAAAM